jgi:hypothetical protein
VHHSNVKRPALSKALEARATACRGLSSDRTDETPESCISHVHFARANAKNVLHQIEGTRIFVVIVLEILPILDRAEEI